MLAGRTSFVRPAVQERCCRYSLPTGAQRSKTYSVVPAKVMTMQLDEMEGETGGREPLVEETKLFVGNLSWNTTDDSLGEAFSKFGNVLNARVVCDRFTGKSRGFGFIEYETAGAADDALEEMNGMEVDGRSIRVDRANRRVSRPPREVY